MSATRRRRRRSTRLRIRSAIAEFVGLRTFHLGSPEEKAAYKKRKMARMRARATATKINFRKKLRRRKA